jgi:4-amino-4-deoxy-L-arabinose transferase-like glycosyltransferase
MIFRLIIFFSAYYQYFLLFIWSRKHFSSKESLIACLLLSTTLIHIEHSHFLNQDSLLFCLGMSSLIFIDLFKDKKNILYLIISGAIIGIGIFTKYTFILFFGFCIIYLFFFYKMRKLRTYYYFFVGVAASSLLFLLPHIILMFSNPNSPYSLINFFNLYGQESGFGSGGMRIENLYYYASKIFNVFGVGLFLIIYKIFKRDKKFRIIFLMDNLLLYSFMF